MANLRTPLYDWHLSHKARMVPFGGWEMPVQYSSIIEEHKAVRNSCGLFDISHMGRLVFTGTDAPNLLQHVFTNDVVGMKPGQVRYGLICTEAGGILDDVLVYRLSEFWLMVVNASNRTKIVAWIEKYLSGAVTMVDRTLDWGMIALQGPRAIATEPEVAGLKYYFAIASGSPLRILSRTGYTGEDGYEVIVPREQVVELADRLTTTHGSVPCGLGARDTLRLEAAMPLYGHELGETIDPFQAGLAWAVKLDKGDFIGRESLLKLKADATRPKRVGLVLEGKRAAREGCAVFAGGKAVGTVCSGSYAPTLEKSIAMAYVSGDASGEGSTVVVDIRGTETSAKVVPLPFYKRKG